MLRDFLSIQALDADEIKQILILAKEGKQMNSWDDNPQDLKDTHTGILFKKASLRTRVSFEVGIKQLGGYSTYLSDKSIKMGERESIHDVAKVLSRYLDLAVIRTFDQNEIETFAKHANMPVINALTDLLHPCQIMGDIFTIMEHLNKVENVSIAYLGDWNNITNSWLNLASKLRLDLRIGTPENKQEYMDIYERAEQAGLSKITLTTDPVEAVDGAEVLYTDVWASMGEKDKLSKRRDRLNKFQINGELVKHADENYLFMHCLPAERGNEVTTEVIDSPHSIIFDQAENRLHIQKAIILTLVRN